MAIATHFTKSNTYSLHKHKEKENRRPEGPLSSHLTSTNVVSNGSLPKRYRSVVTENTPLTSFGVRADDKHLRSHSPSNQNQPQGHQRPLKPVKEFLSTRPADNQITDAQWHANSQTSVYNRSQTDATINNINVALTKTLNKLRPEPVIGSVTNGRSTPMYTDSRVSRPIVARLVSHKNTSTATTAQIISQTSGHGKGPLPAELITRRPTSTISNSRESNTTPHGRMSAATGPFIVQQSIAFSYRETTPNNPSSGRVSTPLHTAAKSLDAGLHDLDGLTSGSTVANQYSDRSRKPGFESNLQSTTRSKPRPDSPGLRAPNSANPYRSLPEVSVHPHIQTSTQRPTEHVIQYHETIHIGEKNTNHRHIQVEPAEMFKPTTSPAQSQQMFDIQPTVIVQHCRTTQQTNSTTPSLQPSTQDALNEAYIDRDNIGRPVLTIESTQTNMNDDSTSTVKYSVEHHGNHMRAMTPPPSPATQELNRIWKKQKQKQSAISAVPPHVNNHKHPRVHRPSCRLKNYDDDSDSEATAAGTQSRDEDMDRRPGAVPSDLGSDAWSDLTSEFSDTKMRKRENVRTSTPNITRQSSSLSSKDVGQIRKQLTDLQIMYNDLLKLLDIDIESMRSSAKSSTSSPLDPNSRKYRFRKVAPLPPVRQPSIDMAEINQRFARLESSIVTLAESIAKLSAQIQAHRTIKEDVHHLRQEIADLRQQLYNQQVRQQSASHNGAPVTTSSMTTSQQPSRLISANVQRIATANSNNPINISTSYMPSTSTIQRSNSIIDPRQARKIEQFFGTEAMLRYFLSLLNYEEYAPLLEQERIGIYELPYISERKLQSLGIPYGPCARIIYEAQQYFISLLTLKSSGIDV